MIRWLISNDVVKPAMILCVVWFALKGIPFAGPIDDVRATVHAWADAWKSRDIIRYIAFYSPAFHSQGLDYQGWMKQKAKIFSESANIQVKISDLWVFVEGKEATARFVQRYQDANNTDIGEKTIRLVNENNKWQIVSEKWMPLKPVTPTVANRQTIAAEKPTTDPGDHNKNTSHPNEVVVNNIDFHIVNKVEKVCIKLNTFSIPLMFTLANKKPRIVVDIKNVYNWKGAFTTPVNGRLIKQIRTYLHRNIHKLRIVLDLNPAKDYAIDQSYSATEYTYCIEIK